MLEVLVQGRADDLGHGDPPRVRRSVDPLTLFFGQVHLRSSRYHTAQVYSTTRALWRQAVSGLVSGAPGALNGRPALAYVRISGSSKLACVDGRLLFQRLVVQMGRKWWELLRHIEPGFGPVPNAAWLLRCKRKRAVLPS